MNQPTNLRSGESGWLFPAAIGLALLAGTVTLVFQIVMVRLAMIRFGAESETLAAVVCMSLVGLSAGAYASGSIACRTNRPLKYLGYFLFSCAAAQVLVWLTHEQAAAAIDTSGIQSRTKKLLFAAMATLPTNFFLGSVIPLLTTAISRVSSTKSFAAIYAAETFGAASGAILAGFFLVPVIGLNLTLLLAVSLTIFSALMAIYLGRSGGREAIKSEIPLVQMGQFTQPFLLVAVLFAGASSMGAEIIWQRFFVLLFGSDTQSFAVVAASYLIGISLGSCLATILIRLCSNWLHSYSTALAWAAAAMVVATLALMNLVLDPASLSFGNDWLSSHPVAYRILTAVAILLVPTTLIGMALPLAVAYCSETNDIATSVGRVYAATLVGNILGLLGTGFIISSGSGLRNTLLLLSCIAMVAAAILFAFNSATTNRNWRLHGLGAAAVVIWIAASMSLNSSRLPLGVDLSNWDLQFYSEGKSNIVSVVAKKAVPNTRRMIIDGVTIGESGGGVDEKQQVLAHLPFLIRHDSPSRKVVTIGLGTGILAGALARNADVNDVTCVELSQNVIEASEQFSDINGDLTRNAKVTIENSDGIHYLQTLKEKVDVIVSDAKSRPGHAGNVAFFSRDYYELCSSTLSAEGIFVQWVSLETAPESVQTILATFLGSFQFCYVAIAAPDSIYLVGANQAIDIVPQKITDYLKLSPELQRYGWSTAADIVSMLWVDPLELDISHTRINTFDRPILELFALRSSGISPETHKVANLKWFRELRGAKDSAAERVARSFGNRAATLHLLNASILVFERPDNWLDRAGEHAKSAHKMLPGLNRHRFVAELYRQLAESAKSKGGESTRFSALLNVSEMGLATAAEHFELGKILSSTGQSSQALEHYFESSKLQPNRVDYEVAFGYSLLDSRKLEQAVKTFEKILKHSPDLADARLGLGICQTRRQQADQGLQNIRKALRQNPELQELLRKYQ